MKNAKNHSPITAWRGTYLIANCAGLTVNQARKSMAFWGVRLPADTRNARRQLRSVGMTVVDGRVRPVGFRPDALTKILGR